MPYIPGSPIEAYCAKCKGDTQHVVLEAAGVQIRLVRCEQCREEGKYQAPRAKTKAGLREFAKRKSKPPAARKRASRSKKIDKSPEEIFSEMIDGRELSEAKKYSVKAQFEVGDLVKHSKFGMGIVTSRADINKVRIYFESGERVMICNRG